MSPRGVVQAIRIRVWTGASAETRAGRRVHVLKVHGSSTGVLFTAPSVSLALWVPRQVLRGRPPGCRGDRRNDIGGAAAARCRRRAPAHCLHDARRQKGGDRLRPFGQPIEEDAIGRRGVAQQQLREHHAGRHGVYGDVAAAQLGVERVHQLRHGAFRGTVGRKVGRARAEHPGAVRVEDVAVAVGPLLHLANGLAASQ
eukprot:ctg_2884.g366